MQEREFFIVPLGAVLVVCLMLGKAGFAQQKSELPEKSAAEESATSQGEAVESQAFLGLGVTSLHPAVESQLSQIIGKGRGVMVANVTKDSPAAQAGMQLHDC